MGQLLLEMDRFGNTIYYDYEMETLYQVYFRSYAARPEIYFRNFPALCKITDTLWLVIDVKRVMQQGANEKRSTQVKFEMNGTLSAKIDYSEMAATFGNIFVLNKISAAVDESKMIENAYAYQEMLGSN